MFKAGTGFHRAQMYGYMQTLFPWCHSCDHYHHLFSFKSLLLEHYVIILPYLFRSWAFHTSLLMTAHGIEAELAFICSACPDGIYWLHTAWTHSQPRTPLPAFFEITELPCNIQAWYLKTKPNASWIHCLAFNSPHMWIYSTADLSGDYSTPILAKWALLHFY